MYNMENDYKFQRVRLNIRWVDYQRIRAVFPAMREESAQSYFRRLALWIQTFKGIGEVIADDLQYKMEKLK